MFIQDCLHQISLTVDQFHGEKREFPVHDHGQEQPVSLPVRDAGKLTFGKPLQFTLVAFLQPYGGSFLRALCILYVISFCIVETCNHEQMHVFHVIFVRYEGNDPAISIIVDEKPCLLVHFPAHALFRTLAPLELTADADPLVMVDVVLLPGPVEHQDTVVFNDMD